MFGSSPADGPGLLFSRCRCQRTEFTISSWCVLFEGSVSVFERSFIRLEHRDIADMTTMTLSFHECYKKPAPTIDRSSALLLSYLVRS